MIFHNTIVNAVSPPQAVALVVKYADNIYKGFGHSISLVFCSTLSSVIFEDIALNETFLLGSFLVVASCAVYASMTANTVVAPAHMAALITIGNGSGNSGRIAIEPAGAYMNVEEGMGLVDERVESSGSRTATALWGGGVLSSRSRASSVNNVATIATANVNSSNNNSNMNSSNSGSSANLAALISEHLPAVTEAEVEDESESTPSERGGKRAAGREECIDIESNKQNILLTVSNDPQTPRTKVANTSNTTETVGVTETPQAPPTGRSDWGLLGQSRWQWVSINNSNNNNRDRDV